MDLFLHSLLVFLFLKGAASQCPDGVQQITLLPAQANTARDLTSTPPTDFSAPPVGEASEFAVPLRFKRPPVEEGDSQSPLAPDNSGTWLAATSETKPSSWKLCFIAPVAPETHSLTLIFSKLQLPLHSRVELETHFRAAGSSRQEQHYEVEQQVLHPWDLTCGKIASIPLKGDVLLLSYFPPLGRLSSSMGPPSSFALEIEAVLQGTRPLPFSFASKTITHAPITAAPPATSSLEQIKDDYDVTIDNTGTGSGSGLPLETENPTTGAGATLPEEEEQQDGLPPTTATTTNAPPSRLTVTEVQAARVANRSGSALSCLPDAGCFPEWRNATQATVLLVLISPFGGRFCTGTLLASPPSSSSNFFGSGGMDQQLILTANHCRKTDDKYTIYNMWGVVFDYGNECNVNAESSVETDGSDGGADGGADGLAGTLNRKILQGLEVVYADEISDILILRVLSEIPETFETFFLGWDASTFPGSNAGTRQGNRDTSSVGFGTVHQASGDAKKLTYTTAPLRPSLWKSEEETHVSAVWSDGGVTQEGSSGAALVDASTGLAVGVLTGGPEPVTCADGIDILGTLYAAWDRGLWEILSPEGPEQILKMEGRRPNINGPGIIAAPAFITLQEREMPLAAAAVKLSDPPAAGEIITITASLFLPPQAVEILENSPDAASIALIEPTQLVFTAENWNISQRINIDPGSDNEATGPLPFQIILELSSDTTPTLQKRRVLKGVRADEELPSGLTAQDPVILTAGPGGIQARDTVTLVATSTSPASQEEGGGGGAVNLGDVLIEATPPGSVYYYNISSADTIEMNIVACGIDTPLQIAIYNDSVATWITSEDCSSELAPNCIVQQGVDNCSGFVNFVLPGLSTSLPPYTITVRTVDGEAGTYSILFSQISMPGELFGGPIATGSTVDGG
ncbi:hypothetical protein Ndes2526B_g04235 [Nannochloris sp. 'desiccata']